MPGLVLGARKRRCEIFTDVVWFRLGVLVSELLTSRRGDVRSLSVQLGGRAQTLLSSGLDNRRQIWHRSQLDYRVSMSEEAFLREE